MPKIKAKAKLTKLKEISQDRKREANRIDHASQNHESDKSGGVLIVPESTIHEQFADVAFESMQVHMSKGGKMRAVVPVSEDSIHQHRHHIYSPSLIVDPYPSPSLALIQKKRDPWDPPPNLLPVPATAMDIEPTAAAAASQSKSQATEIRIPTGASLLVSSHVPPTSVSENSETIAIAIAIAMADEAEEAEVEVETDISDHRSSCHRCGNIRKNVYKCSQCNRHYTSSLFL